MKGVVDCFKSRPKIEVKSEAEELPELDTDSDDEWHRVPAAAMATKPFYGMDDKMLFMPQAPPPVVEPTVYERPPPTKPPGKHCGSVEPPLDVYDEKGWAMYDKGKNPDGTPRVWKFYDPSEHPPAPPPPVVEPPPKPPRHPEPFTFPSGQTAVMFGVPESSTPPPRVWTPRESTDLPSAYAQVNDTLVSEMIKHGYAQYSIGSGPHFMPVVHRQPPPPPPPVVARVLRPIFSDRLAHIAENTTMTLLDDVYLALDRMRERLMTRLLQMEYHYPLYHPVPARVRRPEVIDISHFSRYPPPTIIRPLYPRATGVKIPLASTECSNVYVQFWDVQKADGSVVCIPLFEHGFMDTPRPKKYAEMAAKMTAEEKKELLERHNMAEEEYKQKKRELVAMAHRRGVFKEHGFLDLPRAQPKEGQYHFRKMD